MKGPLLALILILFPSLSYEQNSVQTKEIKLKYTNGYEVFRICTSGCQTNFDDKKEYFWYNEFSRIKSTKGGSGGDLLHGDYKFYDEAGNLRMNRTYYLGLPDANEKKWDSLGNVISLAKYNKGILVYLKELDEKKYWIEYNGEFLKEGNNRKIYTQFNILVSEETFLSDLRRHFKIYYENFGNLEEEYTTSGIDRDYYAGKYTAYYENGKLKAEGQFCEGVLYNNIKVGTWKFYNSDGTLDVSQNYKAEILKWDNGEMKSCGGYFYENESNSWIKIGEWQYFNEDGKLKSKETYKMGILESAQ